MNPGVMDWCKTVLVRDRVLGRRVLEVGSKDFNGSVRSIVRPLGPAEYVGIDMLEGPGVDVVLDAGWLLATYGAKRWDLIICAEMLEHCVGWQEAVYQMKESLADAGQLAITTRSPGYPRHDFPGDYWRFTPEVLTEALSDMAILDVSEDPGYVTSRTMKVTHGGLEMVENRMLQPGVFVLARRTGDVSRPKIVAEPVGDE